MQNTYLTNYEKWYNNIRSRITSNDRKKRIFTGIYTYVPYIVVLSYIILIVYSIDLGLHTCMKVVLIPGVLFLIVSILRKIFNFPRPYTKYNIVPIISKNKTGESFPSRHTFSITIIAMAWLSVYPPVGIALWILSIALGMARVCAGVHFIKDVIAAALISLLLGGLGFWFL